MADRDSETLRVYWQAQWERNRQLEEQRLSVSNFVVAGSVVALGLFATDTTATLTTMWLLASAVALANVIALIYSIQSERWARLHKARARQLLKENWHYLARLQDEVDSVIRRPSGATSILRRQILQVLIHAVLALAAIGLAIW